jgi:hypothetical protein
MIFAEMDIRHARIVVGSLAALLASCAAPERGANDLVIAYVDLQQPTVVAFIPASDHESLQADTSRTEAQVTAALDDASACLGKSFASYRLVYAARIVVRSAGREDSYEIANLKPLVGALLLRPEANPRILFAGGGPEALQRMLRPAVSDYFDKQCDG